MRLTCRFLALPVLVAGALLATPAQAVEGGAVDRMTTHAIAIATGGPLSPTFLCSGTLVAPNVVLTARHCVARFPPNAGCSDAYPEPTGLPTDLWVTATPWTMPSSGWKNVARWVLPTNAEICGNDVVLLVLADPFTAVQATPARPIIEEAELRRALGAGFMGIAGFGETSGKGDGGGTRRSRFDVPIVCVPGDLSFDCAGQLDTISSDEITSGAGPCIGDSGAGAMANDDHGLVLGVLARGPVASCASGIFERTDVWGWLIAKTVLESATSEAAAPTWAVAAFPAHPAVGERCRASECGSAATCISLDGLRSFVCAKRCSAGCDDGSHCDSNVCVAGPSPLADTGCAVKPMRDGADGRLAALGSIALALAVGRWLRGRRDRARGGAALRCPKASARLR